MIPERCPCCLELIDTYGCACPPFEVRHALSNRSGRTYPNPDNGSDDVGVESGAVPVHGLPGRKSVALSVNLG